jgi:hypothetical protein
MAEKTACLGKILDLGRGFWPDVPKLELADLRRQFSVTVQNGLRGCFFACLQDERFVVDEWENPILTWLEELQIGVTTSGGELLGMALKIDPSHWGKPEHMRVGAIMHRFGWKRTRLSTPTKSSQRPWVYRKPDGWGAGNMPLTEQREEPCFD